MIEGNIKIEDITGRLLNDRSLEINEQEFRDLENPISKLKDDEIFLKLKEVYHTLIDILKDYLDLKEDYYPIVALWIMGTYMHDDFPTYPYLFFNAMRGSGKSRLMRLVTYLSKEGEMLNSITEAVLFRERGTLGIDEFEGAGRKGMEALTELLNSAYKRGACVKRMKKVKSIEGEKQVVEKFNVYRPICMANIYGLKSEALSDRCITLVLEKSSKPEIVNKIEIFDMDYTIQEVLTVMRTFSVVSAVSLSLGNIYRRWNTFISHGNIETLTTLHTLETLTTLTTLKALFTKIKESKLNGRELELTLPLILLAEKIGEEDQIIDILKKIYSEKREEDIIENNDISFIEFISKKETLNNFIALRKLTSEFREFLGDIEETDDKWLNERWVGKALKRLGLMKERRRLSNGREVVLNVSKAREKYKMFLSDKLEENKKEA